MAKALLLAKAPGEANRAWTDQPWLYARVPAGLWQLFGGEWLGGRLFSVGVASAWLLALPRLMPRGSSVWHGLWGGLFLLSWPQFLPLGCSMMVEVPCVGMATLALVPLMGVRRLTPWHCAAAALLAGLATSFKLLALLFSPLGWRRWDSRRVARSAALARTSGGDGCGFGRRFFWGPWQFWCRGTQRAGAETDSTALAQQTSAVAGRTSPVRFLSAALAAGRRHAGCRWRGVGAPGAGRAMAREACAWRVVGGSLAGPSGAPAVLELLPPAFCSRGSRPKRLGHGRSVAPDVARAASAGLRPDSRCPC